MDRDTKYTKNFGFSDEYAFTGETPLFEYRHFESPKEDREKAQRLIDSFYEGEMQKLDNTFGYGFACLYTGGTYQKVLRLFSYPPTFDESDREFDSYRGTIIFRDKSNRYYLAEYSGGYKLARLTIYGELIRFPSKYEALLK